ncbi:hypothetical protein [Streptomyces sp. TS71-3]|uniref:hypothetical protein n=1 Tax=Streptomyces sp. TS71-3 TaxID=2733862 RepID=UPI001B0B6DC8|nr:hypothetical protein [Streptomyces sp. TS71-3]GHJ35532.1 hypothetical protein Sm713_11410 [Streptomyces sp. TS71-3]
MNPTELPEQLRRVRVVPVVAPRTSSASLLWAIQGARGASGRNERHGPDIAAAVP